MLRKSSDITFLPATGAEQARRVMREEGRAMSELARVEKAFPAVISKRKFRQADRPLRSRAPRSVHPRRASSPYVLISLSRAIGT